MKLTLASAGRNVHRVVRAGLVERQESYVDRRVKLVSLSSAGVELSRRQHERGRGALQRLIAPLSDNDAQRLLEALAPLLGEPCDPRNALRALIRAAEKAELGAGIGLHTLRHSAATIMLNSGVPVAVVSKLLGHSSIQITVDIYGHEDEAATRGPLEALAAARGRARTVEPAGVAWPSRPTVAHGVFPRTA